MEKKSFEKPETGPVREYNLGDADRIGKVRWEQDSHETMNRSEKTRVEKVLNISISPSGWKEK